MPPADRPAETPPAETVNAEEMKHAVKVANATIEMRKTDAFITSTELLFARALLASRKQLEKLRGDLQIAKEQARDASHVLVSTRARLGEVEAQLAQTLTAIREAEARAEQAERALEEARRSTLEEACPPSSTAPEVHENG